MALWQKNVAPFSEHKGVVGSFLKIPRSNSDNVSHNTSLIVKLGVDLSLKFLFIENVISHKVLNFVLSVEYL